MVYRYRTYKKNGDPLASAAPLPPTLARVLDSLRDDMAHPDFHSAEIEFTDANAQTHIWDWQKGARASEKALGAFAT
jgi:hypothetical protein